MTDLQQAAPQPFRPAPPPPTLVAPRLRLRPLRREDAAQIALYGADLKLARMTTRIPHPYPPGAAEAFVAGVLAGRTDAAIWALDSGEDGGNGLIGLIQVRPRPDGAGEIGYWVAPALWNAGYAGEAVEAVKAHAAGLGMPLVAQVFQDNLASARVLTRAGFSYTGEGETHSLARGGMVPVFCYRWEPDR